MLVKDKAVMEERMKELVKRGKISFKVCANSMRRYGIDKSQLIPLAEVVPVAILELSTKQQQGWSYIKAGH
jgi:intracellular sulfur oxidation DsrE/DsrF family protein